jgi:hypothetical protein
MILNLVLLTFTSSPFSLLATTKTYVFFLYIMYTSAQYINIINISDAGVYHLISSHPSFPEPS